MPSLLDRFFNETTAGERQAWLRAATAEGVVYTHRLPCDLERPPALIAELLAGRVDSLGPHPHPFPESVEFVDQGLDATQRHAVAAALQTPDLYLIQGWPGTGKTRVAAELVTQGARHGMRVLFLSKTATAVNGLLERVAGRDGVLPIRLLTPGESRRRLPPAVQRLTLEGYQERLEQRSSQLAEEMAELRRETERIQNETRLLQEMRRHAADWQEIETRRQVLLTRRQAIPAEVEAELAAPRATPCAEGTFHHLLQCEAERHESALTEINGKIRESEDQRRERLDTYKKWQSLADRQALVVEARTARRYWSWRFWRGVLQGRAEQRLAEFRCRESESQGALSEAQTNHEQYVAQRTREEQRHATANEQIVAAEVARRQSEVDAQLAALVQPQEQCLDTWRRCTAQLTCTGRLPEVPALTAIDDASRILQERGQDAQRQMEFITSWQDTLAKHKGEYVDQLIDYANVLAATVASGDSPVPALGKAAFDLVVVEQAELFAENHLKTIALVGKRTVLIGQSAPLPGAPHAPFHQLWNVLHHDARRLPYQWLQEAGTLSCQFVPLTHEDRRALETERLLDQPDVELRILNRPNERPMLAEVIFPRPAFSIEQAKSYLFQHLGELTLRPDGSSLRWKRHDDTLRLDLSSIAPDPGSEVVVQLEEGVREIVRSSAGKALGNGKAATRWLTVRLEFDCGRGWDEARAQQWLRDRVGIHDFGRTQSLDAHWRARTDLAAFWCEILETGGMGIAERESITGATREPVVFIPVPGRAAVAKSARTRTSRAQRPDAAVGPNDSGSELDLSDPRQRQRLPLDLQLKLPVRGIVNLSEAQAVIGQLERLAKLSDRPADCTPAETASPPAVVLAWSAPQVQLLEALWKKSNAAAALPIEFETPGQFMEREADVVVLSLTRSHDQRALPYAEQAEDWRIALTSARSQLIVVGDALALRRRSQWQGLLPGQDAGLAAAERIITHRLLQHFDRLESSHLRTARTPEGVPT